MCLFCLFLGNRSPLCLLVHLPLPYWRLTYPLVITILSLHPVQWRVQGKHSGNTYWMNEWTTSDPNGNQLLITTVLSPLPFELKDHQLLFQYWAHLDGPSSLAFSVSFLVMTECHSPLPIGRWLVPSAKMRGRIAAETVNPSSWNILFVTETLKSWATINGYWALALWLTSYKCILEGLKFNHKEAIDIIPRLL